MPGLRLLDSSVWVRVLRRSPHPAVQARVQALLQTEIVATSGQIILELLGGTITETEYQRLETRLLGCSGSGISRSPKTTGQRPRD